MIARFLRHAAAAPVSQGAVDPPRPWFQSRCAAFENRCGYGFPVAQRLVVDAASARARGGFNPSPLVVRSRPSMAAVGRRTPVSHTARTHAENAAIGAGLLVLVGLRHPVCPAPMRLAVRNVIRQTAQSSGQISCEKSPQIRCYVRESYGLRLAARRLGPKYSSFCS